MGGETERARGTKRHSDTEGERQRDKEKRKRERDSRDTAFERDDERNNRETQGTAHIFSAPKRPSTKSKTRVAAHFYGMTCTGARTITKVSHTNTQHTPLTHKHVHAHTHTHTHSPHPQAPTTSFHTHAYTCTHMPTHRGGQDCGAAS